MPWLVSSKCELLLAATPEERSPVHEFEYNGQAPNNPSTNSTKMCPLNKGFHCIYAIFNLVDIMSTDSLLIAMLE